MATKKCVPVKNKWCENLQLMADFGNPGAVGLAISRVIRMNPKTNKVLGRGYGLRLGFSRDQARELGSPGVWLVYCPFCGADVSKRTERKRINGS